MWNKENRGIRFRALILILCCASMLPVSGQINLNKQNWIHGSEECAQNNDEAIQIVQYDQNTWIFRQNKCSNYEAPFMFLFLGSQKALLMDTGATKKESIFPLQKTIHKIVSDWQKKQGHSIELIVAHSHKHGDHYAADGQFQEKNLTTLVGLEVVDVRDFFKMEDWPNNFVDFELGNRIVKIIPIPGHQEASIAVYDTSSEILLTGDTFYPGRLYVTDWPSFRKSIDRLVDFSKNHDISYILGNHIEMSTADGVDYPIGSTFHPEEQKLPLTIKDLKALQLALDKLGDIPSREVHKNFIIYPDK